MNIKTQLEQLELGDWIFIFRLCFGIKCSVINSQKFQVNSVG